MNPHVFHITCIFIEKISKTPMKSYYWYANEYNVNDTNDGIDDNQNIVPYICGVLTTCSSYYLSCMRYDMYAA